MTMTSLQWKVYFAALDVADVAVETVGSALKAAITFSFWKQAATSTLAAVMLVSSLASTAPTTAQAQEVSAGFNLTIPLGGDPNRDVLRDSRLGFYTGLGFEDNSSSSSFDVDSLGMDRLNLFATAETDLRSFIEGGRTIEASRSFTDDVTGMSFTQRGEVQLNMLESFRFGFGASFAPAGTSSFTSMPDTSMFIQYDPAAQFIDGQNSFNFAINGMEMFGSQSFTSMYALGVGDAANTGLGQNCGQNCPGGTGIGVNPGGGSDLGGNCTTACDPNNPGGGTTTIIINEGDNITINEDNSITITNNITNETTTINNVTNITNNTITYNTTTTHVHHHHESDDNLLVGVIAGVGAAAVVGGLVWLLNRDSNGTVTQQPVATAPAGSCTVAFQGDPKAAGYQLVDISNNNILVAANNDNEAAILEGWRANVFGSAVQGTINLGCAQVSQNIQTAVLQRGFQPAVLAAN